MAKFCPNCGSPLEDGIVCKKCGKEMKKEVGKSVQGYFKEYLEVVQGLFKKPIDTLKEKTNDKNFVLGLISAGITSIIFGLFLYFVVRDLLDSIYGISYLLGVTTTNKVSFFQVFFIGFAVMAIIICGLAGASYLLIDKCFKGKTTFKKMITLYGLSSIVLAEVLLVTFIFLLLGTNFMIIYLVISLGSLLWNVYAILSIPHYAKVNANMIGYVFTLSTLFTEIVLYLLVKLFS